VAPPPSAPFASAIERDPAPLRIGLMSRAPGDASPVHEECVRAAEATATLLETLGHTVEVSHPGAFDDPARTQIFGRIWSVNAASQLDSWGTALGRPLTEDDVEPATWLMARAGRDVAAVDHVDAVNTMQRWSREMASWWAGGFDLLLTPTLGEPPVPLGTFQDADDPLAGIFRAGPFTPFTPAANMTGQPAISLPLHETPDGLPVGIHLVAAAAREDVLLAVAAQLERAAPWAGRRPRLHA
jgi:amidase